ncbi:MAG: VacJ family lipoprotein [Desulfobulbaceae bacterium]|nr:VacJ family lipoprotein [Desulfobulbaceae bacterium]
MNDRLQRNFCLFSNQSGKRLLASFLLFICLLASGCAALNSDHGGEGIKAGVPAGRLPFPSSRRDAAIEPTVVSYPDYRDPLIRMNRAIFSFNDATYRYLLIPLAKSYMRVIPASVHKSVGNFFYNIKMPVYAVNHLLQLEPEPMGRNLLRFGINTTVGLLGLFDPARERWGLEREETDFEETLTGYGAGYGIYLVLPFFGPSDLRNGTSMVVDYFLDPISYLAGNPERTAIKGYDNFQEYAPEADQYETIRRKSEDPYIFFRNLYLQGVQRDADY